MKIVKLVSNQAAQAIQEKHSKEEIENGIVSLKQISKKEHNEALLEKVIEEATEVAVSEGKESEIKDLIQVCLALRNWDSKFSEKWALVTTRGHYKNE